MKKNTLRITDKQKKLFIFLQKMERTKKEFTLEEIAEQTGYPLKGTVKAKMSRNEWNPFIKPIGNNKYNSVGTLNIQLETFARKISTKKSISPYDGKKIGSFHPEARELILVSKSEFILAIELFNRPSAPNRLDAFLTHFVAAFEKLLKAKPIEHKGIEAIWRKSSKNKKTKSIREIINEIYPLE